MIPSSNETTPTSTVLLKGTIFNPDKRYSDIDRNLYGNLSPTNKDHSKHMCKAANDIQGESSANFTEDNNMCPLDTADDTIREDVEVELEEDQGGELPQPPPPHVYDDVIELEYLNTFEPSRDIQRSIRRQKRRNERRAKRDAKKIKLFCCECSSLHGKI